MLFVALAGIAIWFFGNAALRLPWRVVEEVAVVGCRTVDPARVRDAALVMVGQPLFGADADSVVARIGRLPWVKGAEVTRRLSGRYEIRVDERVPVGMIWEGGFVLLDRDGRMARLDGRTLPPDVPIVTGLPKADSARTAAVRCAARTLAIAAEIPQLRAAISELSFAETGRIVMILAPRGTPVWLPPEPGRDRLVAVASVVAHHPGVLLEARYLDARHLGQIAVGTASAS